MFHKRPRWYAGPALILCMIISWLGAWGCQPKQEREIRIGLSSIMTGVTAPSQQGSVNAAKLAVREVNDAGGLNVGGYKHKVVLIIEDNEDRAEIGVSTALSLINQEGVTAIVGPNKSRNAIPVATICEKARIPMISPISTNPQTTAGKKYVFRATFADDFQGKILASFAYNDLGVRKAAVLYDIASAYNRELAEIFKHVFEKNGGRVVAFETYTSDQNQDFRPQLLRIRDSEPELLFLPNYDQEVPLQVRQARQLGITTTFLGSDSWPRIGAELLKNQEFEGSFFSDSWSKDRAGSNAQGFIRCYREAYKKDPSSLAALTYDAFGLLFHAIQSQGRADPESIRNGLANIKNYNGVTGNISYQGSGNPAKSAVILQIKEGRTVFYKQVSP